MTPGVISKSSPTFVQRPELRAAAAIGGDDYPCHIYPTKIPDEPFERVHAGDIIGRLELSNRIEQVPGRFGQCFSGFVGLDPGKAVRLAV
jgi:hypothetical protein